MTPSQSTQEALAALIDAYRQSHTSQHQRVADRLQLCGSPVERTDLETGEVHHNVHHCDVRACPRCQRRHQRLWLRETRIWLPQLIDAHDPAFLFLSIGFRNVDVEDTRSQLQAITDGFGRIHRVKKWPALGCATGREFTIADDGSIHFNIHCLVGVHQDYFKRGNYLTQPEWRDLIRKQFKLKSLPSVNIQKLQGRNKDELTQHFLRAFSYISKAQKFESKPEVGIRLADQLHRSRRLTFTGLFKSIRHQQLNRNHTGK
jgi:Replication protein